MSKSKASIPSSPQVALPALDLPHGALVMPTVRVPMVTKTMSAMLQILNEGSIWDLGLHLKAQAEKRLVLSKEKQTLIGEKTSMELVLDPKGFETMMQLLHSLSKDTIAASILSTVGYQSLHDQARRNKFGFEIENPIKTFHGDGPGAYIATLHVKDRNGWLDKVELGEVIDLLEQYLKISLDESLWQKLSKDRTASENANVVFINQIDQKHAPNATKTHPVYMRPDQRKSRGPRLEAFIKGLKRMHGKMQTEDDYIVQSPQYVGCSSIFADGRSDAHDPDGRNYSGCNFLLWLTSSCMKASGYPAKVLTHPILRTWKVDQVKVAEVLLTMLSSSMCWQFGLNSHPPGTSHEVNNPDKRWEVHRRVVLIEHPWYQENIEQSRLALLERKGVAKWLETLPSDELNQMYSSVSASVEENERQIKSQYEEVMSSLERQESQANMTLIAQDEAKFKMQNHARIIACLDKIIDLSKGSE